MCNKDDTCGCVVSSPDHLYNEAMESIGDAIQLFAVIIALPNSGYNNEMLGDIICKLAEIIDLDNVEE